MEGIVRNCCLLVLIGIAAGSRTHNSNGSNQNKPILDFINGNWNKSANPCEDFQNFAGGWFEDSHIEDNQYHIQDVIRQKYNDKLQFLFNLLKDRVFIDEDSVEEKVWIYYNTCLEAPKSTRSLRHYLQLVPPGENLTWPQFTPYGSEWPKEKFQWLETLAILRRYGMTNLLMHLSVDYDDWTRDKFSLVLYNPDFNIDKNVSEIQDLLISTGVSPARSTPLARSILNLNSDLEKITDKGDLPNQLYTLEEIQNRTGLQLGKYLEIAIGHPFEPNYELAISDIKYLEGLIGVLEKYDSEVVASYLMVQFSLVVKDVDGSESEGDDFTCVEAVAVQMELASELLYRNYYMGQGKLEKYDKEVQRIFSALQETLITKIEENRLNFSNVEVTHLQQKVLPMRVQIGTIPTNGSPRRFVTKFYYDLNLDADLDFAKQQLNVLEHLTRKEFEQLNKPVPRGSSFFIVGDFLSKEKALPQMLSFETIFIPYDALEEPFFAPESHDVFEMSLMGYSLAAEMLKVFWPKFIYYDSNGIFTKTLTSFDNEGYIENLACLNRSSESKDLQQRLDDVASLQLVYDTYFGENSKFRQSKSSFTKMSVNQIFLLNFAQNFLGDEKYLTWPRIDSHKIRLHEAVRNLPAFAEVFHCPKSAPLNPEEKCKLW